MNNNGFMLLAVIAETGPVSGYKLNQIMERRGYRAWADIGSTSIYVNLKKLSSEGLIEGVASGSKNTKGPESILYRCLDSGKAMLVRLILESLQTTREHDRRFDLALSVIQLAPKSQVLDALNQRVAMLSRHKQRIQDLRQSQSDELSYQGNLLFERTLYFLENEREYTVRLIRQIDKELN